jgi:hypothetical protein
MADRIVELIRQPDLVASMSEAALAKAAQHGHEAFLGDWRKVLEGVIAKKDRRTHLESVTVRVSRLGYVRPLRLPAAFGRLPVIGRLARTQSASAAWRSPRKFEVAARLTVDGHSKAATLDSAVVTLEAVAEGLGAIAALPLEVRRSGATFQIATTFDLAEVFKNLDDAARSVRLRLRLVWENSSWETHLTRPRRMEPNYEVSFSGTGELALNRGKAAPR